MIGKNKRDVLEFYNELGGKIYDIRYKIEQESKFSIILNNVSLDHHDILLDNGCGTGLLLEKINNYVIGVDLSQNLLKTSIKRLEKKKFTYLIQADADYLPLKSSIFNWIFAVTLLQNMPEPEKTLLEMKRVSRENGQLVITALKKSFSIEQFNEVLKKIGFKDTSTSFQNESNDFIAFIEK